MRVLGRVFLVTLAGVFTVALLFSLLRRRRRFRRPVPQLSGLEPYTGGQSWGPRIAPPALAEVPSERQPRHRPFRRTSARRRALEARATYRRRVRSAAR